MKTFLQFDFWILFVVVVSSKLTNIKIPIYQSIDLTILITQDIKQIFHAFFFSIRNYSPDVSKGPRVINFNIKQKMAWNMFYYIPQWQTNQSE